MGNNKGKGYVDSCCFYDSVVLPQVVVRMGGCYGLDGYLEAARYVADLEIVFVVVFGMSFLE